MPTNLRVVVLSACENGINNFDCCTSVIPMPVSVTTNRTPNRSGAGGVQSATRCVFSITDPCIVNFTALDRRFVRICLTRPLSNVAVHQEEKNRADQAFLSSSSKLYCTCKYINIEELVVCIHSLRAADLLQYHDQAH